MTFPARLTELIEKATKRPWNFFYKHKYNEFHVSVPMEGGGMKLALFEHGIPTKNGSDADLIAYLVNHAEAIRDLVVAAEQEHGGNHHEPECPICVALAKFNDAGEK